MIQSNDFVLKDDDNITQLNGDHELDESVDTIDDPLSWIRSVGSESTRINKDVVGKRH